MSPETHEYIFLGLMNIKIQDFWYGGYNLQMGDCFVNFNSDLEKKPEKKITFSLSCVSRKGLKNKYGSGNPT